jgi:hypothetical protein
MPRYDDNLWIAFWSRGADTMSTALCLLFVSEMVPEVG